MCDFRSIVDARFGFQLESIGQSINPSTKTPNIFGFFSWATSDRYHEEVRLPCLFGCEAKDELAHYLECPILWAFVNSAEKAHPDQWSCAPQERACFVHPDIRSLKCLAVAYRSYHALRLGNKDKVARAVLNFEFDSLHELFLEYFRHFVNELALHHAS